MKNGNLIRIEKCKCMGHILIVQTVITKRWKKSIEGSSKFCKGKQLNIATFQSLFLPFAFTKAIKRIKVFASYLVIDMRSLPSIKLTSKLCLSASTPR